MGVAKDVFARLFRSDRGLTVPPFETYYPSVREMSEEQAVFYGRLKTSWNEGAPIPIEGQISYVFCLAYELIGLRDRKKSGEELLRLARCYEGEAKISEYCRTWAADCFAGIGDFKRAVEIFPAIPLNSRASMATDTLLTFKYHAGLPLAGRELLTLFGPKVTSYAKKHLADVERYLADQLVVLTERDGDLLRAWVADPSTRRRPAMLFSGVPTTKNSAKFEAFDFSLNGSIAATCAALTREAENAIRGDAGLPRVGEGWIEETRLFYALQDAFSSVEVLHHARLEWLGQQHLDIFIPSLMIAVEYQGLQHDEPVEFFGGQDGFEKAKKRDARKRHLCKRNGVRLIEVREGYVLDEVVQLLRDASVRKGTMG